MRVKQILALLILSTSFLTTSNCVAKEKFKVCADPLHPPYSSKTNGGFENQIAELFATQLGQEVEYYWFPQRIGFIRNSLKQKIPDSDQYRCDVVMGVPAGYDLLQPTKPYYQSSYVMLIAKNRGWNDIEQASQLGELEEARKEKIRIAMFDRGPGTAWIQQYDLIDQGIPYQTMTGDHENNTAMIIDKDLKAGKIDIVIIWGPMAGYIISNSPKDSYTALPMRSGPGMRFSYPIAMGVRYGDNARKEVLNQLIDENQQKIDEILSRYNIPLSPLPAYVPEEDDDD